MADELGRAGAFAILVARDRRDKNESLLREGGSSIENAALLSAAGAPLGRLLGQVFGEEGAIALLQANDWDPILEKIDLAGAGADLGSILSSVDGPALTRRILDYTMRDNQPLSDDLAFDAAFSGNYLELFKIVIKVANLNKY